MNLTRADVPTLLRELDALGAAVQREFTALSPAQLNWQPARSEWSIAQCFDHLVIATTAYFPTLDAIQAGSKRATVWERVPLAPSVFGRLLQRVLDPDHGRKVPAPRALRPAASAIDTAVVDRFLRVTAKTMRTMEATAATETLRIIVTSPATRFVTYSLLDAYRIIVVHDHLHVRQARRVAAAAGFPPAAPRDASRPKVV